METEAYSPCVMYAPDGKTRRVDSLQLEKTLVEGGWAKTPFPAPPEPAKPLTVEQRIAALEDLVAQHDALLMQRRGGRPKKEE